MSVTIESPGNEYDADLVVVIPTQSCKIKVSIIGAIDDPSAVPIITYHEAGTNAKSCFQTFFQYSEWKTISSNYCIYNINAPGHIPDDEDIHQYPSFDELVSHVRDVVLHFKLSFVILFGVGAGATILLRYATLFPNSVRCLILIAPSCENDTVLHKISLQYYSWESFLSMQPQPLTDKLKHRYFTKGTLEMNIDIVDYINHEMSGVSAKNMAHFLTSVVNRNSFSEYIPHLKGIPGIIYYPDRTDEEDEALMIQEKSTEHYDLIPMTEAGVLATVENPQVILEPLKLFFIGQGIPLKRR